MKKLILTLGLTVILAFVAVSVQANTWLGYFTSDHMTDGAGTAPFGEVALTDNMSGGVDFTVTLYDGSKFIRTGAGDFYDFKFNATGIDVTTDFSDTGLIAETGNFDGDGGGMFHYGVYYDGQGKGGSNAKPGPIVFTIANATIDDFTSPAVIAENGTGQIFVADVISGQTGFTGLIDVSKKWTGGPPPGKVPEPITLVLYGMGFAGAGLYRRLRSRK